MALFFLALAATEAGWIGLGLTVLAFPAALAVRTLPGVGMLVVAAFYFGLSELRMRRLAKRAGIVTTWAGLAGKRVEVLEWSLGNGLCAACYQPENAGSPRPLIVVVHGGGWEGGTIRDFEGFSRALAASGCIVASVEYRLSPDFRWPAQRADVRFAIAELTARASELGADPANVFLLGRSAGGQIAAAVACGQSIPGLRGCISLYAPFDMVFAHEVSRDDDLLGSRGLVLRYMGGTPDEVPDTYRGACADQLAGPGSPPQLILHGTRDEICWVMHSRRFALRIAEEGVACEYHELPWATHAFDFFPHGPGGRFSLAAIRRFIARHRLP